jgi:hypothetical protein
VAIFEILWHWPHLFVKGSEMLINFGNLAYFCLFSLLFAYIASWIYNRANGNWIIAGLFHASVNGANMLFFSLQGVFGYPIILIYIVLASILYLIIFSIMGTRKLDEVKVTYNQILTEYQEKMKKKYDGKAKPE